MRAVLEPILHDHLERNQVAGRQCLGGHRHTDSGLVDIDLIVYSAVANIGDRWSKKE